MTTSRFKSPGDGLPPYELDNLIGKRLRVALKADATLAHNQAGEGNDGVPCRRLLKHVAFAIRPTLARPGVRAAVHERV